MDTVVHRKRYIYAADGRKRFCTFDVRRWIMPPEDETMGRAWEQLSRAHRRSLGSVHKSHRHDLKAKAVWNFVVEHIKYTSDDREKDFWQFPPETILLRHGDCEDKAFLCASLLLAAGVSPDRVRVILGALATVTSGRTTYEGHCWPMYRNAHGKWCILEPNIPHLPVEVSRRRSAEIIVPPRAVGIRQAVFLSADRLAADGCREQYVPLVCFNHRNVWTVEQRHARAVSAAVGLHPDWGSNPTFDEILRDRRMTGP